MLFLSGGSTPLRAGHFDIDVVELQRAALLFDQINKLSNGLLARFASHEKFLLPILVPYFTKFARGRAVCWLACYTR